jgi:hypothetical protein
MVHELPSAFIFNLDNIKSQAYFVFPFHIYKFFNYNSNNSVFNYLRADLNSQWQITESARI